MRFRITYANAMATLALFIVIGGTAHAAVRLNSRNVANSSITTVDVKSGSLTATDLSAAAKRAFTGPKGDTGRAGSTGSIGATGETGAPGERGSAAFMTSAFAHRDTGVATQRTDTILPNNQGNGTGKHWDATDYSSFDGPFPQLRTAGQYAQVNLNGLFQSVVELDGMGASVMNETKGSSGRLKVSFSDASLIANGSVTLLHRRNGENLSTNASGTLVHGRAACWIYYEKVDGGHAGLAGMPGYVSAGESGRDHELVNVAISGTATGLVPGAEYDVSVICKDLDYTGSTQWQLANANLTALASR